MDITLNLVRRGISASGAIDTMYQTNISLSDKDNIDQLEAIFLDILKEYADFVVPARTAGDGAGYRIACLYDTKADCWLLNITEHKKCIHRLFNDLSVTV